MTLKTSIRRKRNSLNTFEVEPREVNDMGYLGLKPGETIKCRDRQHMKKVHDELAALGIRSDYLYVKDGKEGTWIIIEPKH